LRRTLTLTSTLTSRDGGLRVHELAVQLPPDYPHSPPACAADLPGEPFVPLPSATAVATGSADTTNGSPGSSQSSGAYSLRSAVLQWEALLAQHRALFDQLDDLDDHTWVLEPARIALQAAPPGAAAAEAAPSLGRPPHRAAHRRSALAPHASVLFALDPLRPHAPPTGGLRFLGKGSVVAPLRLHASQSQWDASGATSLRANLEACLGAALPSPQAASSSRADVHDRDGFEAECAICYAYRLPPVPLAATAFGPAATAAAADGSAAGGGGGPALGDPSIPDIVCANARCNRSYHSFCLSEWLRGLPSASRSFDTVFGHCPYCFVPISARAR
jgi:E3 ubiquitin-protein ligase FANCL